MGDDILFLALIALIFFIGINFYKFEGFQSTPEGQLYQTQSINTTTTLLNDATTNLLENISSMVNSVTDEIQSKINSTKDYVEGCVDKKTFSGTVYFPSTCYRTECPSVACGLDCGFSGCKTKYCTECGSVPYPCTESRTESRSFPYWNCSPLPDGYQEPKNPFPIWL
jgi:hypothetical protein